MEGGQIRPRSGSLAVIWYATEQPAKSLYYSPLARDLGRLGSDSTSLVSLLSHDLGFNIVAVWPKRIQLPGIRLRQPKTNFAPCRFCTMDKNILLQQFRDSIFDCRRIYVDKAIECVTYKADLSNDEKSMYMDEAELLFARLVIKVFVEVSFSDCVWSQGEGELGKIISEDLLGEHVSDRNLLDNVQQMYEINTVSSWQEVLEPFLLLEELGPYRVELEAALLKMANIIAKIDGNVTHETMGQLKNLKWQLRQFIKPIEAPQASQSKQIPPQSQSTKPLSAEDQQRIAAMHAAFSSLSPQPDVQNYNQPSTYNSPTNQTQTATAVQQQEAPQAPAIASASEQLEDVLAELDELIGIDSIKDEVRGLVNFLKVQEHRKAAGLPEDTLSMHMVFEGNPGTGKTTVARILARVFAAIGVLDKGHLVETDRSGLVAEFVGQTAPKANAIIDSALGGVLFIDEAYSLVGDAKDSFGAEAMQILLKRAEDDRDQLIVILAGYCDPMKRLLQTNPGLSSRFSRSFNFVDYSADELVDIFEILAEKNHYVVTPEVRDRLLEIASTAIETKDEHFGNGRLMRNVFEGAIRQLADRVVDIKELTAELLTTFELSDLDA